jgi:methionyl-tRNA formyltransferase
MPADLLLLGGTDATLSVAEAAIESGARLAGIVSVGDSFSISYAREPVRNVRSADPGASPRLAGVPVIPFTDYDALSAHLGSELPPLCLVAGW